MSKNFFIRKMTLALRMMPRYSTFKRSHNFNWFNFRAMKNHKKRYERKQKSYVYPNSVMGFIFFSVPMVYTERKRGTARSFRRGDQRITWVVVTAIKFRLLCWWIKNVEANLWIRVSAAETLSNAIVLSRSIVFCTVWYSTVARWWSFDRLTRPHSMALYLQNNRVPEF